MDNTACYNITSQLILICIYSIAGKLGEFTLFEHLAEKSLWN